MITSRRDYVLRLIDEVGRLLARVVFKRKNGSDQEALESIVLGFQRLVDLQAHEVFLFTPEQHYAMMIRDETPQDARDKVLLYAALSAEAAAVYAKQGNGVLTRATRLNALRFTLRALANYPREDLPSYTPDAAALREALAGEPFDEEINALLTRVS
jgi:hypothetical protein